MASKYWIKVYHEMLDDPKVMTLRPAVRWRFIETLLVAGEMDDDGYLPDTQEYAWRVRASAEVVETEFAELAEKGLLTRTDGRWLVTKFAERQASVSAAERMRRYRERQKKDEYYGDSDEDVSPRDEGSDETVTQPVTRPVTIRNTDTDTDTDTDAEYTAHAHENGSGQPLEDSKTGRAILYFCDAVGVDPPKEREKRKWGEWVQDTNTLLELVDDDEEQYQSLVNRCVTLRDENGWMYTRPGSIVNVARREVLEPKRERDGPGPDKRREAERAYDWLVKQGQKLGRTRYKEWGVPKDVHAALMEAFGPACVDKVTGTNPYQWQEDFVNVYAS